MGIFGKTRVYKIHRLNYKECSKNTWRRFLEKQMSVSESSREKNEKRPTDLGLQKR